MEVVKKADTWVPLFVMTSEKNHDDTTGFFAEHDYFGYNKDYVFFFVQEMAAAASYDGKFYMEEKGRIATSPNGNGGWFSSLAKAGLLDKINELGVEWLNVFAVDNVLQKMADPVFVGATIDAGCVCGSKVVAKAEPNEKVGVLCLEDGKPSIVEYYEMTDEIINSRDEKGKLLYNYGVILNYLFEVKTLTRIMNENMPTHVVEKKIPYINEKAELVKPTEPNGYKFETLVLDMIHMMDNCLSFEVERSKEFAPIKNRTGVDSLDSARELMEINGITL
jgi:UDP-N-acetylglucosamine/UDP-N-acetylgalactosamine diphosphorylase